MTSCKQTEAASAGGSDMGDAQFKIEQGGLPRKEMLNKNSTAGEIRTRDACNNSSLCCTIAEMA
jgi:hypothetical protein